MDSTKLLRMSKEAIWESSILISTGSTLISTGSPCLLLTCMILTLLGTIIL